MDLLTVQPWILAIIQTTYAVESAKLKNETSIRYRSRTQGPNLHLMDQRLPLVRLLLLLATA